MISRQLRWHVGCSKGLHRKIVVEYEAQVSQTPPMSQVPRQNGDHVSKIQPDHERDQRYLPKVRPFVEVAYPSGQCFGGDEL
jgi:hypothetical protein